MKIGVTGANGLLGRSIVGALQQLPKMEIRALVRQLPRVESHPRTDWLLGDLARPEDCRAFVAGLDVVLHCAHKNSPLTSDGDWAQDARLNLIPTLNLLGAIEGAKRCPHLIYPSSGGAVYGLSRAGVPFRESDPCLPENSYGIQKLAVEHYLRVFAERELLTATVLRIGNAYGWLLAPDRSQGFIGTAINRVLHGQPVRLIGDPHNVRDYVYVDDILSAIFKVLEGRRGFEVFNVGSGVGASVMDILSLIERKIGKPPLVRQASPGARRNRRRRLPSATLVRARHHGGEPAIGLASPRFPGGRDYPDAGYGGVLFFGVLPARSSPGGQRRFVSRPPVDRTGKNRQQSRSAAHLHPINRRPPPQMHLRC